MIRHLFSTLRTAVLVSLAAALALAAVPRSAGAMCCPFPCQDCWITAAGQLNLVVMDRENGRVRLIPNIRFVGTAADFALVVPTPSLPALSPAEREIWDEAARLTAPVSTGSRSDGLGCGRTDVFATSPPGTEGRLEDGVTVHGRQTVGAFDSVILSSTDPDALVGWLRRHSYDLSDAEAEAIAPYAARGWFFTAMKLDTSRPEAQVPIGGWDNNVDPVVFHFDADDLEVPLAMIGINRSPTMPLVFYIVDDHRASLDGFQTTYANRINAREFEAMETRYPNVSLYLSPGRFLTRLDRSFAPGDAMTGSMMMKRAPVDDEFRRQSSGFFFGSALGDLLLLGAVPWIVRRARPPRR